MADELDDVVGKIKSTVSFNERELILYMLQQ